MKILFSVVAVGLLLVAPLQAFADVKIFACEPEWEALVKEIGKNRVKVKSATNALNDPHYIRARPSLIAAIRRSDLVICSGNDLEIGWLPILLENAKLSVQLGQVGHLMAADYVKKLEVPKVLDRSHGDVHAGGNPHIHLNPYNISKVASELTKRLVQIDKENDSFYQENLREFLEKWQHAISKWESDALRLKSMPIVVHHKNWVYLVDWLGLNEVATLEPKPGIPPSISHLERLLEVLSGEPVKAVVHAPYEDDTPSKWLAEKVNIPVVELPFTVGGNEQSKDLYGLFDSTISKLLEVNE